MHVSEQALVIHRGALVLDFLTPLYMLDEPYTEAMIASDVNGGFLSVSSEVTWDITLAPTRSGLKKIDSHP